MSTMVDLALQRPSNYSALPAQEQWDIDQRLGILDWDPTPAEAAEFERRWEDKVRAEKVSDLNDMTGGTGRSRA